MKTRNFRAKAVTRIAPKRIEDKREILKDKASRREFVKACWSGD